MTIVAEAYRFVVGVDTHAATHTYAIIECPTGALVDQQTFATTPAAIARAGTWITRRTLTQTDGDLDAVLVVVEGTGSYGAILAQDLAGAGYRVVEAPTPRRERGRGKSDDLDALAAARTTLPLGLAQLRDRRGGGHDTDAQARAALQILSTARDQLNSERLRTINALTALVRTHQLGIDARRALTSNQIDSVATWRHRQEPLGVKTARTEATRLAKRITALDADLKANNDQIQTLVAQQAPQLLELSGVGALSAAVILAVWSHPGRVRSEAAFAAIAGTAPIPASSGNTTRHRLNRGGDRRLNRAINTVVLTRTRLDPATRTYIERRQAEGKTNREIRRCLKRYVTRQLYRNLNATNHYPHSSSTKPPGGSTTTMVHQ